MKETKLVTILKMLPIAASLISAVTAQAMDCTPSALTEKALEMLSIPGVKISLSRPTPVFERHYDFKSKVVGYSLRYYRELGPDYGEVGELDFPKIGDSCYPTAFNTSETATPIAIPSQAAKSEK